MLQYMIDLIAYIAADPLQVFFICNFIILVVLVTSSSLKTTPGDQQLNHCLQPLVTMSSNIWEGVEKVCREVPISVKEVATDDDKLRTLEERRVQDQPTFDDRLELVEVLKSDIPINYDNTLSTLEAPQGNSIENNDLLRLEGSSFFEEDNSYEIFEHCKEDDQFRKRVEAFISKMNNGLRDEMMQATNNALAVCN